MSQQNSKITLAQLVEQYYSQDQNNIPRAKQQLLSLILTHEDIIPSMQNQTSILKKIFTYEHVSIILGYLIQENKQQTQQLEHTEYDASGENVPLCLRLPFMAMKILSYQCQIINDLLFASVSEHQGLLVHKLMGFLDQPPHYHLASYFSKVICAITKRVSSISHKYNPKYAECIFGGSQNQEEFLKSSLFKSIQHLYSLSTIQYLTKWLIMSSKNKVKVNTEGVIQEKIVVDFRRSIKNKFMIKLVSSVNSKAISDECINNIPTLFEQMLSQNEKNNQLASSLMIKSLPNNSNKITLYDLATGDELIDCIFKMPEDGCLSTAKLQLIKVYIKRYLMELSLLNSQKGQGDRQYKILQNVTPEYLQSLLQWIVNDLQTITHSHSNSFYIDSHNQNSPYREKEVSSSQVTKPMSASNKMIVLALCSVLRLLQSIPNLRIQIIQFYNEKSSEMVALIGRLMGLQNNLIQLQASSIVLQLLNRGQITKNGENIPLQFAHKLLAQCTYEFYKAILQLLQIESAKVHVVKWADIILSLQSEHIFQDYQEQFQWEHIRQTVQEAKLLQIGQFRLMHTNIQFFYSEEKALNKFTNFINDFKVEVVYEQKKEAANISKIVKTQTPSNDEPQPIEQLSFGAKQQQEQFQTINLLDFIKGGYMHFDVNHLMQEL